MHETVMLERQFDPSISLDDLAAMEAQASWCLEQYRVERVCTFLSSDGHETVCAFAAPDAEAVRRVMQQLAFPYRRAWAATRHGPDSGPAAPEVILVERSFAAPVEFDQLQAQEDAGGWCLTQHGVHHLRSYLARDQRRMICLYTAPDAEAVRSVQRQIGLPHDRVWAAQSWQRAAG